METIIGQYSLSISDDGEEISIRKRPEYRNHGDGSWWECCDQYHRLRAQPVLVIELGDGSVIEQVEVEHGQKPFGTGWDLYSKHDCWEVYRRPKPPGRRPVYETPGDLLKPYPFANPRGRR